MLNIQRYLRGVIYVVGLLSVAACTPQKNDVSRIGIAVPAMTKASDSAQSLNLSHLVINVSGAGITNTILQIWDQCKDCPTPSPAPAQFFVDVPSGKERLVQVLAVYEGMNSANLFYGDKTADFTKIEEKVTIAVADLTGGLPLVTGAVAGRYLDQANAGPTDEVEIRYQPSNGRPSLILERGSIANGWFSLFALHKIPLRYVLKKSGRDLFGEAVDLSNRTVFKPSDRVVKVFVPYYTELDNGTPRDQRDAEINVIGYFGPGAASAQAVCRTLTNADLFDGKFVFGQTTTKLGVNVIGMNDTEPTAASLTNTTTPAPKMTVQGALLHSSGVCSGYTASSPSAASNLYQNYLPLRKENFQNGRDGVGGFRYPFGLISQPGSESGLNGNSFSFDSSNISRTMYISSAAPFNIGGKLLPGLSLVVTGIRVYKLPPAAALAIQEMDYAPCGQIKAGDAFGSQLVATTGVLASGGFFAGTSLSSSEVASQHGLAMCFDTIVGPTQNGVFLPYYVFNGSPSPSGPYLLAEGLRSYRDQGNNIKPLTNGKCYAVELRTYAAGGGFPAPAHNLSAPLTVNFTNPKFQVYPNASACGTGGSTVTAITMAMGTSVSEVYIKPVTGSIDNASLDLTLSTTEVVYNNAGAFSRGERKIKPVFDSPLAPGACVLGVFRSFEADGVTPYGTSSNVSIALSTDNGAFRSPGCFDTVINTATLNGTGGVTSQFAYVAPMTGTDMLSGTAADWVVESQVITLGTGSHSAASLKVIPDSTTVEYGRCVRGRVAVVNENGAIVRAPTAMPFNLSADGHAQLYSNASCTSPFTTTEIPQGMSSVVFYFKSVSKVADFSLQLSASGLPGTGSMIYPTAPTASNPYFVLDGDSTYRGAKVIGSHEFDGAGYIYVPVDVRGTISQCQISAGACDPADFNVAMKTFRLRKVDLLANSVYSISMSGSPYYEIRFTREDIFGKDVEFIECDHTHSTTPVTSVTAPGVHCLGSGVEVMLGVSTFVDLTDKAVIGKFQGSNTVSGTDSDLFVMSSPALGTKLANLNLNVVDGNRGIYHQGGGSPVALKSLTISIPATAGSATGGVRALGGVISLNDIKVEAGSGADGSGLILTDLGSSSVIENVNVEANNSDSNFTGLSIYASTTTISGLAMKGFRFVGEGNGLLLSAATPHTLNFSMASDMLIDSYMGIPLKIAGHVPVVLNGLQINQYGTTNSPIVLNPYASENLSMAIVNGRVQTSNAYPMVKMLSSGAAPVYNLELTHTHWIARQSLSTVFDNQNGSGSLTLAGGGSITESRICRSPATTISGIESSLVTMTNLPNLTVGNVTEVPVGAQSCY